jgi:dTDP-4-dehydrorhamnose reductase
MPDEYHLIIGGDGKLGAHLGKTLRIQRHEFAATTRRKHSGDQSHHIYCDLNDRNTWENLPEASVAYICAGITSVEQCESQPDKTYATNVGQTVRLVEFLAKKACRSVLISTNRVFDGLSEMPKVSTATSPTTEYGRQKVEVEKRVLTLSGGSVVRLGKVLFPDDELISGWLTSLSAGHEIKAVTDMYQSPVSADLAVSALLTIGLAQEGGLYQLSATSDMSMLDIAGYVARSTDSNTSLIKAISRIDLAGLERTGLHPDHLFPRHTALDSSELSSVFGIMPPTVAESLQTLDGLKAMSGK